MTFNPLVSIIIPVYNGANYMREAIDSALAQTYPNIEVIVVNDGSTDDTEKIALSYGDKIRYFSKENGGVATALNLAIQKSKGDYISWLSHDDVYYPNKIERQIQLLKQINEPKYILFSDFDQIFNQNKERKHFAKDFDNTENKLFSSLKLLMTSGLHGCTLLIPRHAFSQTGMFDETLKTTQDYTKWYQFLKFGYRFYYIPEILISQRIHNQQDTIKNNEIHLKELKKLNEFAISLFKDEIKNFKTEYYYFFVKNLISKGYTDLVKEIKRPNILQIGDNDLIGNKFNGHDLHLYLREKNIDANHIIMMKLSDDKNTFLFLRTKSEKKFTESLIFSDLFLDADIIHLHLIHNTLFDLNYLPIITAMKPTVITLHDPYFLGGHCIHHFDCEKWKSFCKDCPNLDSPFPLKRDSSAFEFAMKKHIIQNSNITAIVASKWMENKVAQSPIWQGKTIHRLPFGINQDIFKPEDKNKIRKDLNIPQDATVLMFRSDLSPFKGLDLIKNALKNLKTDKKIVLLTVAQKGKLKELKNKFDIREYGWLKDDKLLAKLYQASDLFLMPSTQEAFGMMAIEAMSCKVPVLALTGTALPDVINSPQCGLAVDADKFSTELQRLINTPEEIKERGEKSLTFAKENYDKEVYINKMINIYKEVIANHKTDAETEFVFEQLNKYAKNSELRKRFKLADNKLWRLFYKLTYRIYLKKRYGRKVVHEKYDKKYL